jgi:hypothetical protein
MARPSLKLTQHPRRRPRWTTSILALTALFAAVMVSWAAETVPTDIQMPGTQPTPIDNPPTIDSVGNCGCHNFSGNRDAEAHPVYGWEGAMMGNAGRDPLFWSTVAIAEQDFLPGSGGVGDLCIKCHSVGGWLAGRSTPTDASSLIDGTDDEGVMCHFCHQMVNPDQENSIPSPPEGTYVEEQSGDFVAYDEATGEGYYGGAEYVLNSGGTRLGPFADHVAKHNAIPSPYFRDARFCGTCHDVSNPAVGDLAHNFGALLKPPGDTSGVPGAPVAGKAAFNNKPYEYGVVERTFSEFEASAMGAFPVQDFVTLPADLQVAGGAYERAYRRSLWGNCSATSATFCNTDVDCPGGETCITTSVNYQDGQVREYTCQTCHMAASVGLGAGNAKLGGNPLIRPDLPRHDQTGAAYWIQDAIKWQDDQGTLLFGGGLSATHREEMTHAQGRAEDHLRSAASLGAVQDGNLLKVRVTNLTPHKLISGYPEGRRMFLNIKWLDEFGAVVAENGAYGPLGNIVTDNAANPFNVESILDFDSTKIYEAKPGMTREWAQQLLSLGYPAGMVLEWDRLTNAPVHTLGELAGWPSPEGLHGFHFVLNNTMIHDNRIPPFGMDYDESVERSILPIPASQYGNPGPGGTYEYWDEEPFPIPVGAVSAEVRLYYQSTSWEYVQFLWKQNDGSVTFLANEGVNMLDAWLNAGGATAPEKRMSPPFEMASVPAMAVTGPTVNPPGTASGVSGSSMEVTGYDPGSGAISLAFTAACGATGSTVHYGNLANVSTYTWAASDCGLDSSGTGFFVPDPAVGESIFWVVVGNNADWEGGYGTDSHGGQRPPNVTNAAGCLRQQSVRNFCE